MADGGGAGQALDRRAVGKMVAHQTKASLGLETAPVESDNAGRLLPTMLQGVKAKSGDRGGVWMAEYAEHAAFFAQAIGVKVEIAVFCCR
jgi:hypothetical protein